MVAPNKVCCYCCRRTGGVKKPDTNAKNPDTSAKTPLPKAILLVSCSIAMSNSIVISAFFTYNPQLVIWFGFTELESGYYAGILGSAIFFTATIFSLLWGYLSDVYGNKKVTMIQLVGSTISLFAFCFTNTFTYALLIRMIQGVFIGCIGNARAAIRRACDDTNVVRSMALVLSASIVGLMFGTIVSGFLTFPVMQYPNTFNEGFLSKYPIFLPNFIFFVIYFISMVFTIKYYPEDERMRKVICDEERIPLLWDGRKQNGIMEEDLNMDEKLKRKLTLKEKWNKSKLKQVLSNKWSVYSCVLFGILSLLETSFMQLFPLYCASPEEYKGLNYEPKDISTVFLGTGVILSIAQVTSLTKLINKFGAKRIPFCFLTAGSILYPLIPLVNDIDSSTRRWVATTFYLLISRITMGASNTAFSVIVNNSAHLNQLAFVNSMALFFSFIANLIGPVMIGSLFSWSLTNVKGMSESGLGFPFNQHFPFFILSTISMTLVICISRLPTTLNKYRFKIEF